MSALSAPRRGSLKRLWRNIHLWLGIGLLVLLVPIGLSGAILVYHDDIDAFMHTPRGTPAISASIDLARATESARRAAGEGFTPRSISIPDDARAPLTVSLSGPQRQGERPARRTAYVDRSDAHVLELLDPRDSFFGFMHVLHGNLQIPNYGRDIVGWMGVAMLILSLTGLYLWWPRRGQWSRAFVWRRAPATSSNLHYMTGFWICFPLAFVSLTGIYISFPQQGRAILSSVAPISERERGGALMPNPQRSPSEIYAIATARPNATVDTISFPNARGRAWSVRLHEDGKAAPVTITIDDRTGAASVVEPLTGDSISSWIRWLHEGSYSGEIWRFVLFLTGIMPAVLGVTGVLVWLRQRRQRKLIKNGTHIAAKKPLNPVGDATPAE